MNININLDPNISWTDIVSCIGTLLTAIFTALLAVHFNFKKTFQIPSKIKKFKNCSLMEYLQSLNKLRDEINELSLSSLASLEKLSIDDVEYYFSDSKDREWFKKNCFGDRVLRIDKIQLDMKEEDIIRKREKQYNYFYKKLSGPGQCKLKELEIKLSKNQDLIKK